MKEEDREKAPRRPRTQRTEKVQRTPSSGREARQAAGAKKPIISVVLTAHEAIPGDHFGRDVTKRASSGEAVPGAAWPCDPGQLAHRRALVAHQSGSARTCDCPGRCGRWRKGSEGHSRCCPRRLCTHNPPSSVQRPLRSPGVRNRNGPRRPARGSRFSQTRAARYVPSARLLCTFSGFIK